MESVNTLAQSLVTDSEKIVAAAGKHDETEIGTLIEHSNESIKKLVSTVSLLLLVCSSLTQ
jgi:dihydroxyacetone kinase DhaKLM complex PTS-EIIA-like component DhaM